MLNLCLFFVLDGYTLIISLVATGFVFYATIFVYASEKAFFECDIFYRQPLSIV